MIEIGENSFPQIFRSKVKAQEMAGRIIVLRPTSLSEFKESLQQMKTKLLQHEVKLLVVDSMAALITGENERFKDSSRQTSRKWPLSFLKSLAEFSRIPIVVTNQVRSYISDESSFYSFQGYSTDSIGNSEGSHLAAALGIQWAHAVNIGLIFEAHSDSVEMRYITDSFVKTTTAGQRFIKVAKSPVSPSVAFSFVINSSGITLLSDDGIDIMGQNINTIRCQGQNVFDI